MHSKPFDYMYKYKFSLILGRFSFIQIFLFSLENLFMKKNKKKHVFIERYNKFTNHKLVILGFLTMSHIGPDAPVVVYAEDLHQQHAISAYHLRTKLYCVWWMVCARCKSWTAGLLRDSQPTVSSCVQNESPNTLKKLPCADREERKQM